MNRLTEKILGLILVGILLLPLASCDLQQNAKVDKPNEDNPNYDIKTLVYIGSQNNRFYYYYDKDTKVMYVIFATYQCGGGMTPLYNPDGTLKLYEESENN
jgi:hypothetical protein